MQADALFTGAVADYGNLISTCAGAAGQALVWAERPGQDDL